METHKVIHCPCAEEKLQLFFLIFGIFYRFKWLTLVQTTYLSCFIPFLFSFFLFCFHAPVSLLLYFSLCICSRHLLILSAQHLLPNLLIKASEFAFEKPVCPTRSWPRDRQALDINEILAPWNATSEQSNVKTTLLPAPQIPGVP